MLFTNQTDVTNQRNLNAIYQNNTGRPIFVSVSVNCVGTAGTTAVIRAHVEKVSPPTISVAETGLFNNPSAVDLIGHISFIVPEGFFYSVDADASGGSLVGLNHWIEYI